MNGFELSDKCIGCPAQHELVREVDASEHAGEIIASIGSMLVGETGQQFDEHVRERFPEEVAEELITGVRRSVSDSMDDADKDVESIETESEALSRSCDGVFKLRAIKEGKEYTVAICTSARLYHLSSDTPNHASAHISVTSKPSHGFKPGQRG